MEKIICSVFILTSACCWCDKYVFVKNPKKTWSEAWTHCKEQYIDFLSITSEQEEQVLKKYVNDEGKEGWIGIYWDKAISKWTWTGGELVAYHSGLSLSDIVNAVYIANNAYWTKDQWEWKNGGEKHSFFCLNMRVVQEKKTWENALEFCREQHTDLTSLLSVTENRLAQIKIQSANFTEQVWIGLRYLGDTWLWVNGDPLLYEAWQQDGDLDHQCPMLKRCGALTKNGVWEGRDCQEKLSFICV